MNRVDGRGETTMPEIDELVAAVEERLIPEVKASMAAAEAAGLPVRVWPPNWEATRRIDYLYRSGALLTHDADVPRVAHALQDIPIPQPAAGQGSGSDFGPHQGTSPVNGITHFSTPVSDQWHTYDTVSALEKRLGPGVVTHEHIFTITTAMN